MQAEPWVSIVMPVYNGGNYFEAALASALAQDYRRFEIVVVDDGSTDGVAERVAGAAGEKVRYIRQANQGVAGALNTGIEAAKGDIFCWLSHDDLFVPHKLRAQAAFFSRLATPDAALFSDYELMDAQGVATGVVRADHRALVSNPMLALLRGAINGCTVFVPMSVMSSTGKFDRQYRYTQDYRFWNKLISRHEFFHQPEILVRYRLHDAQDSMNAAAIAEGDELWIDMMRARTETERTQISGSSYRFFRDLARHLSASPLAKARSYAEMAAQEALLRLSVSLVVPTAGASEAAIALSQSGDPRIETLVIVNPGEPPPPLRAGARRVRTGYRMDANEQINVGIKEARGAYVAIQRPGRRTAAFDLSERARQAQTDGVDAQLALRRRYPLTIHDILLQREGAQHVAAEDLLLHRNRIDAGQSFDTRLLALDDSRCLLAFCQPDLAVWPC